MSANAISFLVFAGLFASAMLALRLNMVVSDHHLCSATKDTVKLTMGLVATMTALILGLLVSSTKSAYDAERSEITQMSSKIIYLDRVLVNFGPESAGARKVLRKTVEKALLRIWPEENASNALPDPGTTWSEGLPASIQKLSPQNDAQRADKSEGLQISSSLAQMRWLLFEQEESSISMPMLLVVISWLGILFFSFGLFAPANPTAIGALMVASISVAGAIFLILELDQPFSGFIKISSEPMRNALVHVVE